VVVTRALGRLLIGGALAGCSLFSSKPIEQRTTEGLTAEEMFTLRIAQHTGREPTFEERQTWKDDIDQRITDYLDAHPEAANSFEVSRFRFLRQASVGMTKEQILILLGPPLGVATEPGALEKIARKYWPDIRDRVAEAWGYPEGWNLFFKDDRVVAITQYLARE
jgi:hypothetical protein